jgi:S-DNA-T family DNA segregation ATPase FtsK/SpoIIIE
MIDPKMLELSVYNGIPHLLTPVVTDPKKAVLVLKWVVKEMENRYKMMSYLGVRNIQNYNQKIDEAIASGTELFKMINLGFDKGRGEPITEKIIIEKKKFHYIVVIVDEMADLMLVAGKELEFYVQRIAQMARAAGIHIIMATQRPSVDVITGVIKANLPTRISFAVTNKIDSRTILGEQGAEQLLGMGDMLYMPSGGKIIRVHGPFVSDKTVEDVVNYLHSISSPQYIPEILEEIENNSLNLDKNGSVNSSLYDDSDSSVDKEEVLYRQALNIVLNEKKTSISYIQRQLRIGYNKSANLIERMEKEGFLSQPNHQGKREILKNE